MLLIDGLNHQAEELEKAGGGGYDANDDLLNFDGPLSSHFIPAQEGEDVPANYQGLRGMPPTFASPPQTLE